MEGKALGVEFPFTLGTLCAYFVQCSKFVQSQKLYFDFDIFILRFLTLHILVSEIHLPENDDLNKYHTYLLQT